MDRHEALARRLAAQQLDRAPDRARAAHRRGGPRPRRPGHRPRRRELGAGQPGRAAGRPRGPRGRRRAGPGLEPARGTALLPPGGPARRARRHQPVRRRGRPQAHPRREPAADRGGDRHARGDGRGRHDDARGGGPAHAEGRRCRPRSPSACPSPTCAGATPAGRPTSTSRRSGCRRSPPGSSWSRAPRRRCCGASPAGVARPGSATPGAPPSGCGWSTRTSGWPDRRRRPPRRGSSTCRPRWSRRTGRRRRSRSTSTGSGPGRRPTAGTGRGRRPGPAPRPVRPVAAGPRPRPRRPRPRPAQGALADDRSTGRGARRDRGGRHLAAEGLGEEARR